MRLGTFAALGALAVFCPLHAALATCSSELSRSGWKRSQTLPSACRAMGPLHLRMSYADIVRIMGAPAASEAFGDDEEVLAYALPQAPSARKRHASVAADPDNGYLRIILRGGRVVSLWILGTKSSAAAYPVGDIAVGESISWLLKRVAAPPLWNKTRDNVILGAYPIEVEVNPDTHRLTSIDIFTSWKNAGGPLPVFSSGQICFEGLAHITCGR